MLFTVAHELTHFIRQWSPEKFKVLSNILLKEYAAEGMSVEELVEAQKAKAKRNGRELTWEEALEEVTADSMETVLTDGNVVEFLETVRAQDMSLGEKIAEWFRKLAEELKALISAYTGYTPDSAEGKAVAQMKDVLQTLEAAYVQGLQDAGENFRASGAEKITTREGDARYSIRNDVVDVNGTEYDSVVELNKAVPKRVLSEPRRFMNYIANNLLGLRIPVTDANGNTEIIEFAGTNETVTKNNKRHPVLGELIYTKGDTRKLVIVNAKEVIQESMYDPFYSSADNEHGWLDKNGWESRKTYVLAQDGNIYEAYLKIAKAKDGRNILYAVNLDINKGIAVDQGATSKKAAVLAAMPSGKKIAQSAGEVKEKFSERDAALGEAQRILEAENAKLSEDVERLRELVKLQKTVTGGTRFTKTSLEAEARVLKKYAGATAGDSKELAGLLEKVYGHIAGSGEISDVYENM